MMRFRSELEAPAYAFALYHPNAVLCIGSCFAEHIALRLEEGKLPVCLNPFGIVYNPVSIARQINCLVNPREYTVADLFFENDLWHSFDHHGVFSDPASDQVLSMINSSISKGAETLKKARLLIVTLGTAFVFELQPEGRIVANCHKAPANRFNRRRLSVEETERHLAGAFDAVFTINPDIQIVLTVSPVKHLRDGLIENQRSKACLLLAADTLSNRYENVHYFPAYEYVTDDLRDYRFYEADLAHPNKMAVDYVWEKFEDSLLAPATRQLFKRLNALQASIRHRPFNPDTPAHRLFVGKIQSAIEALESEFPFLDFSPEKANLQSQIN